MFNLKASYPYQPEINQVAFDLISKTIKNKKDIKNILDVGCGYGLLSKQLKRAYPRLNYYGIEHAKEASQSSQKILKLLRCDIEDISYIRQQLKTQKFDIIISNPPYIPEIEKAEMHINVKDFEPSIASSTGIVGIFARRPAAGRCACYPGKGKAGGRWRP
jgi:release factor glutamine methyltransferase